MPNDSQCRTKYIREKLLELEKLGHTRTDIASMLDLNYHYVNHVQNGRMTASDNFIKRVKDLYNRIFGSIQIIHTCPSPHTKVDGDVSSKFSEATVSTLKDVLAGAARNVELPEGVAGTVCKIRETNMYLVAISGDLDTIKSQKVLAHELEDLAKGLRRKALSSEQAPIPPKRAF